ncbi:hypothetical protein CGCTS75_v005159 [Colletotrichum tropicale]|nr:hypothetical protein CGCTS75_v005159 [Colletotrichum tropicale]
MASETKTAIIIMRSVCISSSPSTASRVSSHFTPALSCFFHTILARLVIEWLLMGKVFLQLFRRPLRDPESSIRLSPRCRIPPSVFYRVKCSTISVGH